MGAADDTDTELQDTRGTVPEEDAVEEQEEVASDAPAETREPAYDADDVPHKETREERRARLTAPDEEGCGSTLRNSVAEKQAHFFSTLGGTIARLPVLFIVVLWTLYFGIGFGLWYSHLESEARKLWVQKGSRLEDEKDFLEKHYHGLDRPVSWQITHEGETDNGKSVMTREHILELYEVDKIMLDMRPGPNRRFMVQGGCVDPTLTNVTCNAKTLCGWDDETNSCLFHDKFGLLPSQEQRGGTTVDLLGVKWGWREICNEAPSPPVDATAKNPSPVSNLRAPCSKQMTPMDCFKEHAYSQQSGTLELLGWSRTHPVSNKDTHLYHSVFKNPCGMW
eukprot:Rhum_TRINITY_DN15412_c5_g2::Rhum_TRINITY_DN15412_c5_g2_i3::g.156536::m.156536